jgi:succinate dehydrogenase/fumarate reductase cytochrome b subunit
LYPDSTMYRAQDIQYVVLWSIAGPFLLVLSLFLSGRLLLGLATPNSGSWMTGLGSVLFYCSLFGAVLAAHVFAFFGSLGLVVLPWRPIKYKALSLAACATAVCTSVPVLVAIYFNYQLWPKHPWS